MALESLFMNLVRGNRLSQYMGLSRPEGAETKYGPQYSYIEIPVSCLTKDGEIIEGDKALRNQHVYINPECSVHVRGDYHLLVEPNPALAEYGQLQGSYYIHSGEGEKIPGFYITLRKDLSIEDIRYAVRLYLQV